MLCVTKLKDIREDNDINQEEMAKILDVKRSTYSLWELGINIIPLEYLCRYADYFQYSIDYVLDLTKTKECINYVNGFDLKKLGNNLKELRLKNNLSQQALADKIGVTQACILRYEKALICISLSNLYKISKEFNVSIQELCGKGKIKN